MHYYEKEGQDLQRAIDFLTGNMRDDRRAIMIYKEFNSATMFNTAVEIAYSSLELSMGDLVWIKDTLIHYNKDFENFSLDDIQRIWFEFSDDCEEVILDINEESIKRLIHFLAEDEDFNDNVYVTEKQLNI